MKRRTIVARIAALAMVLTSTVILFLPAPSSAAEVEATGWWSRRLPFTGEIEGQSAGAVRYSPAQELPEPTVPTVPPGPVTTIPLPVPVPTIPKPPVTIPNDPLPGTPNPTVPDGGLWVANDPTGAAAMSAIRFQGDIGSAELTLQFAPGSTTTGPMIACPVLSGFTPGPNGAWADRPAHDCERLSLGGRVTSDGSAMEFTIPQGFLPFGERVLDVVLLPDPTSGDVFSMYFQPPTGDSLDVTQGQELPAPTTDLPDPDPGTLPEPVFADEPGSFDGLEPTDFSTGGGAVVTTPDDSDQASGPSVPEPIAQIFEPFIESRVSRIIAMAVLLAMGGALWYFGGSPIRQPRLLGALAGDAPVLIDQSTDAGRGIGRFRRDRTSPPPRL